MPRPDFVKPVPPLSGVATASWSLAVSARSTYSPVVLRPAPPLIVAVPPPVLRMPPLARVSVWPAASEKPVLAPLRLSVSNATEGCEATDEVKSTCREPVTVVA